MNSTIPVFSKEEFDLLKDVHSTNNSKDHQKKYQQLTIEILKKFLSPEDNISNSDLSQLIYSAYSKFDTEEIVPLQMLQIPSKSNKQAKILHILELWFFLFLTF